MDLDQSGVARQWTKTWLGPSLGFVMYPLIVPLNINVAGTYAVDPSTSIVNVNVAGAVTIVLPAASWPSTNATAQPFLFVSHPISIIDVGGNAAAYPITIMPVSGAETIMGLPSIQIVTNNAGYTLTPLPAQRSWVTTP
jgi:hypothetical protein